MKNKGKRLVAIAFIVLAMMASLCSTATAVYIPRITPSGSTGSYTFYVQAQSSFFTPQITVKQRKCSYTFRKGKKTRTVKYYPHYEITVIDKTAGKTYPTKEWDDLGMRMTLKRGHYYVVTIRYTSYVVDTLRGINPSWTLQSSTTPYWWLDSSSRVIIS